MIGWLLSKRPALLVSDDRILVQVVKNRVGQIVSMKLDGTDARDFTHGGEGLPYGLSLSPDARRVAFHLASPQGYQVWTSDVDGTNRIKVAAHPDHLYFGTSWSPDGQWILYVDCHYKNEPGHDWADVCVGRADGSEHRVLTEGQPMWFAATYGDTTSRGSGSNLPAWTHDGCILYPRRTDGARIRLALSRRQAGRRPFQSRLQAGRGARRNADHASRSAERRIGRARAQRCRRCGIFARASHPTAVTSPSAAHPPAPRPACG